MQWFLWLSELDSSFIVILFIVPIPKPPMCYETNVQDSSCPLTLIHYYMLMESYVSRLMRSVELPPSRLACKLTALLIALPRAKFHRTDQRYPRSRPNCFLLALHSLVTHTISHSFIPSFSCLNALLRFVYISSDTFS